MNKRELEKLDSEQLEKMVADLDRQMDRLRTEKRKVQRALALTIKPELAAEEEE